MKIMTNTKKKTFFTKLLLATSSIGLLASAESFAVDIIPVGNPSSNIATANDWRYNAFYHLPQNNDNIIITENNHRVNFTQAININSINLYGFNGVFTITEGEVANPTRRVSINNITNVDNPQTQMAVQNALGVPLAYGGNNNAKAKLRLTSGNGTGSELTITGNDISAVESIELIRGNTKLIFQRNVTVDAPIYSCSASRGVIEVKDDVTFEKAIGLNGEIRSIYELQVNDNKSATLKSDIYATNINLGRGSALIVNPLAQDINVQSGISIARDNDSIIKINENKNNKVKFYQDIGAENHRVKEINIARGRGVDFEKEVYAKKIKVESNDLVFKEKVDMTHRNGGVIDTGDLEFTSFGKVKVNKDFTGNITTTKTLRGEVTFVETPDIYEIGSQNKQVRKVAFEGDHAHNLHKDIHANTVELDAGTYNVRANPVTIDGNANINGSTLNLKNDLIFNGNVEFSGNIRINATGGYGIVFHNNNLPSVIQGTNIILNVNGAFPPNGAAALSMFRLNNGEEFVPVAYNYENATGTFTLPQGLQAQQPGVQAAAQPAHALVRADATIVGNVILTRETVDTLGQREAGLHQDMAAVPNRVQQQVNRENLRLRQAQNTLVQIQADNPQQLAEAQQRFNAAQRAGANEVERIQAEIALLNARNAVVIAQQELVETQREVPAQIARLQQERQDRQREMQQQIDNIGLELLQARRDQVDAQAQLDQAGLVVPADALAEQQRLQAQQQNQQGQGQGQGQVQQNQQGQAEQQRLQGEAQVQRDAEARRIEEQRLQAEQQRLQVQQNQQGQVQQNQQQVQQQGQAEREANERAEGQRLQAQQQQEEERRNENENERLAQQEANERAIVEENNRRIEEQRLQAEYQQRQDNEIRVAEEYVKKPESQKLAEAINNTIVVHTENTFVAEAQKEMIKEKSALVMQNPEKHAVELAKELVNNKAQLQEAVKVANDDAAIKTKTKQEQSLLFVATLAQVAAGKEKEAMKHSADQGTRSVSVASITTEAVSSNINNHFSANNMVAVAAGDEDSTTKKAVWVAGTFGSSSQGEYKGNPSYNGTVAGGTIGADLYIGENNLVGIAYSRMNSDFKFKGLSTGDKLSAESDIISVYGQQQFGSGFILQEIFSASNSKVNKKDVRLAGKIAQGKYTSTAYAVETNIGYQFAPLNSINLIPNIGIRYNNYKDKAYTETGAGVNNMYVAGKSGNLVTGIAGIKLVAPQQLSNDTQIIPGLHASVENSFNNKQPNVKARFIWADSYFENNSATKMSNTAYNVGASVLTKHKNIELLATYNCNLRSKYQSHQGSLKLKLLF